ncbi:MAG: tRNA uridine-5-carboxymethylaminomethyl(34) synthesis GTPase MnmE [Alphaproteobacteria bacterium RIFCSPLOWO2_01_FULL_40_26]|nr:MAG: tRNA uridine-5-carboxymethylaminomethyl(34) synthesis GTPase MnmE [Alphaproteobacteria bacterium RIFCSPHIGHO2_02_FULL_40_34]OFW94869.1 MAG: tRNA uridine-5-carboxymethylaminomethyl(34) synthesis GTPase MnmE [Alphaproteobacteria bacterium RIFCSPLOWO2_01_FULL_40_26]OFX10495.1 MAG: tRNA uridine-5-carboxymethylaminomethyl(34) synthesis GTPase MnmE [Alphaproteobacteria bacterium RIFCSPLOWO2_02_FULL_40_19]OFX10960.1 MAG: tRNA uridine-5-carboxymethylaminomethyl(34) synthesis GTPase MnmE [Alphapr
MSTIFALITSPFRAGISVIRISGDETLQCLKNLGFKGALQHQKISFQKIFDPKTAEKIDEVLVSFFKAPQSFTGEDVAEISIHASPFILKKILEILSTQKNCRLAEAGEFSKRAFLNGKLDLVQAEAIPDLIAAETELQHRQALMQLEGKLGKIYENWRLRLIEISAFIAAAIDFPDEDLPENIITSVEENVQNLRNEIKKHLDDKKSGQKIKDGLSLAIIGAPNVGKSSLINFLAQSEVAIVSEIPGTTRDVVEVHLSIAGMPVKISDTAGLRETSDPIEKEGIARALQKARLADIKIFMFDAVNPVLREDLIDENTLLVVNKIDLGGSKLSMINHQLSAIELSLTDRINTSTLLEKLEEKVLELAPKQNSPLITQERYRTALQNSVENLEHFSLTKNIELAAEDLRLATNEIGKIIGKVDIENILDIVFSRFCIGK